LYFEWHCCISLGSILPRCMILTVDSMALAIYF
jgi:hypothetical protein